MTEVEQRTENSDPGFGGGVCDAKKVEDDAAAEEIDEAALENAQEKKRREDEARAQALTLEIIGDLPYAEVKPPENVLFVCKLNPVTEDADLDLIFSRFGTILSCEVIRDKRTGDSLQYAFIEFGSQKDCEQAYFKMQAVLIDDHRIHVDFSQSVSRLSDKWRTATNSKRLQNGGGFGGISELEKKRHYRAMESKGDNKRGRSSRYGMVFDKDDIRRTPDKAPEHFPRSRRYSRSRSPRKHDRYRERTPSRDKYSRRDDSRDYQREGYEDRSRRR